MMYDVADEAALEPRLRVLNDELIARSKAITIAVQQANKASSLVKKVFGSARSDAVEEIRSNKAALDKSFHDHADWVWPLDSAGLPLLAVTGCMPNTGHSLCSAFTAPLLSKGRSAVWPQLA
jgi:hypothetical protein